jgi:hypothetical protein
MGRVSAGASLKVARCKQPQAASPDALLSAGKKHQGEQVRSFQCSAGVSHSTTVRKESVETAGWTARGLIIQPRSLLLSDHDTCFRVLSALKLGPEVFTSPAIRRRPARRHPHSPTNISSTAASSSTRAHLPFAAVASH